MPTLLCFYIIQKVSVVDVIASMVWNGIDYTPSNFSS